jgi:hypothetical protein
MRMRVPALRLKERTPPQRRTMAYRPKAILDFNKPSSGYTLKLPVSIFQLAPEYSDLDD